MNGYVPCLGAGKKPESAYVSRMTGYKMGTCILCKQPYRLDTRGNVHAHKDHARQRFTV